MMIRTLLASVGLAAITLTATAGIQASGYFDDGDGPPPRVAVSYAGLDLTTQGDLHILEQRINTAIDDVCPRDWTSGTRGYSSTRDCRDHAIRGVEPQVKAAIGRAWTSPYAKLRDDDRPPASYEGSDFPPGFDQRPAPPSPPANYGENPPPSPVTTTKPRPGGRLVRRTVVTTTVVTTTRRGPPEPDVVAPPSTLKPAKHPPGRPSYARRPSVPGSWLPPVAWRAIERATLRAFATGGAARWHVRDRDGIDRDGYVTVSAIRWIGGCAYRNVRVVKQAGQRQIVVADGTRCRRPGRGLTG